MVVRRAEGQTGNRWMEAEDLRAEGGSGDRDEVRQVWRSEVMDGLEC